MSKLFEKTHVKSLTIQNRFIRSATWEGMATKEGACTQKLTDLMVQLAQGGVGTHNNRLRLCERRRAGGCAAVGSI